MHYDKIDNTHMQEQFIEKSQGLIKAGRKITHCPKCKQWVSNTDFARFCKDGYCEFSEAITLYKRS